MTRLAYSCLVGLLFVLPHGVRAWRLHSFRDYSPFSARTASPTVWDETFMYGAEVNYSYRHHTLAYDADTYEHRNEPVPYSVLPAEVEVLIAAILHSVGAAQIFCHFFFPFLCAWLLAAFFRRQRASEELAAFLALFVLIAGFSPVTIYEGLRDLWHFGWHSGFVETLQYSRNPHPNMSFPFFLGILLLFCAALRKGSWKYGLAAGILGGLLYYTYIYYAIAWSAAIAVLTVLCFWMERPRFKIASISLCATVLLAIPFVLWTRSAAKAGGYLYRSARLGMIYSHIPSRLDAAYSVAFLLFTLLLMGLWAAYRIRSSRMADETCQFTDLVVLVFGCAALGGIAGMNLELVTGFNVQAAKHYTHMVIQPVLIIVAIAVFLTLSRRFREKRTAGWGMACFFALLLICATVQVSAAINSAEAHRIDPSDAALFAWLDENTTFDDVVATTSIAISTELPVFTHNYTLLAEGTATSGSDDEVLDRFLLASALTSTPPCNVARELIPVSEPVKLDHPLMMNYAPFLYEISPYRDRCFFRPALMPKAQSIALARYAHLNLGQQLHRFRVNYVYVLKGQTLAPIPGWQARSVFETREGALWKLEPAAP